MARVLITGGLGFIGANLAPMLETLGNEVIIYDNHSKGSIDNVLTTDACEIVRGDILDPVALTEAVGRDITAVIHLAASGSVVDSSAFPEENFANNVQGTFNLLEACKKNNVYKIVFASTGGALIGNATPPVNESSLPRPISPYGASKLAGEGYCCSFAHSYKWISLRSDLQT